MPNFTSFDERWWIYACQRVIVLRISSLQFARPEVFDFLRRTWPFRLVYWLSVWVRQVLSSILGMTHFTNLNEMCGVVLSKRYWLEKWIYIDNDLDVSWSTYNIDKCNCLSCMILPLDSSHRESNFSNALLQCRSGEVFELRAKTRLINKYNLVILLSKVFGLMAWFSLWVGEVPS